ncbi:MAG TPA: hypothetical protein VF532_01945 [Candidatus Angelobacter sp.]
MFKSAKALITAAALMIVSVFAPALSSQQTTPESPQQKNQAAAPVPAQILTAKKVFISNLGVANGALNGIFNGTTDRAYQQFYAAMLTWGHYELVSSPAECDLVFEINVRGTGVGRNLKLVIRDLKTRVVLWTIIEYVEVASRRSNLDKNFDKAVLALVNDVARLAGLPPAIPVAAKKNSGAETSD